MNRDDIIRMAHEAGLHLATDVNWMPIIDLKYAQKFANLVAAAEREACAKLVWPTQEVKVWSDNELEAMTGAFNKAQEKHGWYETIMAVGATALKASAAAIRARGEK